ncbi:MAG: hypothetical protein IPL92_04735 [Saprospiraceae bacterium]|nr:hypothetical protein [Candidatus Opimibacter iunctus]
MKTDVTALPCGQMLRKVIKISVLISLVAVMMAMSCKKDDRVELFQLRYPPPPIEFDILPGLNTFDTHIYTFSPLPTEYLARLVSSGYTDEDVISIEPKKAALSSLFGDEDINFISKVSIYVYDPFIPSHKVEFLYLEPVPFKSKTVIQLFPGITDITEWMKAEYFGVEIRLNFRENSPSLTEMKLEFDLRALGK